MGMTPAKCTSCGNIIQVDETREAGICVSCGTPFITEKVINNYTTHIHNTQNISNVQYVVKNVYGKEQSDAEDFIRNGEQFLSLEEYEKARNSFQQAVDSDASNWRGWFGIAKALTKGLKIIDDVGQVTYIQNAKKLLKEEDPEFTFAYTNYKENLVEETIKAIKNNNYKQAFQYVELSNKLEPNDSRNPFHLAKTNSENFRNLNASVKHLIDKAMSLANQEQQEAIQAEYAPFRAAQEARTNQLIQLNSERDAEYAKCDAVYQKQNNKRTERLKSLEKKRKRADKINSFLRIFRPVMLSAIALAVIVYVIFFSHGQLESGRESFVNGEFSASLGILITMVICFAIIGVSATILSKKLNVTWSILSPIAGVVLWVVILILEFVFEFFLLNSYDVFLNTFKVVSVIGAVVATGFIIIMEADVTASKNRYVGEIEKVKEVNFVASDQLKRIEQKISEVENNRYFK